MDSLEAPTSWSSTAAKSSAVTDADRELLVNAMLQWSRRLQAQVSVSQSRTRCSAGPLRRRQLTCLGDEYGVTVNKVSDLIATRLRTDLCAVYLLASVDIGAVQC